MTINRPALGAGSLAAFGAHGGWTRAARRLARVLFLGPALLAALPAGLARAAEGGVEGLAALRGDFVPGAVVLAFAEPGPGPASVPLAVSAPTDGSGRYRMALAPGSYYLVAVKSSSPPPWPFKGAVGDQYCYYLGNPVVVEAGRMTRVGFNMPAVREPDAAIPGEGAGIQGRVLFEDAPLARAYVHVYRDGTTNFRGVGLMAQPTGDDGRFRMRLPPGRYYVLARKRKGGGVYGPPGQDDFIGYYPGNPVEVRAGALSQVTLETTTRVDLIEKIWFMDEEGAGWFEGTVADGDGAPAAGVYVLFYVDAAMTGNPAFVAGPTDAAGRFRVRAAQGRFHLLARSQLGGPLEIGEWRGTTVIGGEQGAAAGSGGDIRITVGRFRGQ